MPHSFGYRARTRDMFARDFRKSGTINLSTYLKSLKVGDYVDVIVNGAVHKGMPHKFYHGRTGIVYNVTKNAVGVEVNKILRGKQLKKRINVRVEHVRKSKSREDFIKRVKANDVIKQDAKKAGLKIRDIPLEKLKRQPKAPKGAFLVRPENPVVVAPVPFDDML
mmetsp:Transcript_104557/g.225653  ORF Transcript_104557/g.225653 Transcript_104557/m.225653 type:complete len:165 (+) Transcript_104557:42-536(+)|eukprot:CAMPEP_0116933040 /NCGR_PEP_ID=MMETSP0467-20121206/28793_1 /TAXON_ID=283647 /ORGANISM="Mesodinium pulex, Strain SPMC105" /LENGTH=164 /DNA_ID=CAMNT_0004613831 /DNA_START=24 /DNA_END=518 /DNA_ORIENTATION=+